MLNDRITLKAAVSAVFICAFWGGNSPAIKVALDGVPPLALAGVRFFLGALTVLVWVLVARIPLRLNRTERRLIFSLLTIFVLQIYLLHSGTKYTLAAHSGVFVSSSPFFLALFAHFFLPEDRLNIFKITGMSLSFAGVVLIFAEGFLVSATNYLLGDAMVLLSGLLLGARQIYTKTLTQSIHPARLLFWQATFGTPIFFLLSAVFERGAEVRLDAPIVAAILYQGVVVAGLGFIFWTVLMRRFNASRLGVFGFITPISGVLISYFLLGEPISNGLIAGMLLVGAGIAVVNFQRAEVQEPEAAKP
jgi:drug/metabolite transporter (DMT)-like permease